MHPPTWPADHQPAETNPAPSLGPDRGPHVDLVSQWCLPAPPGLVWAALSDPSAWPHWWPVVREVRRLRDGGADGVGSLHRIAWTDPRRRPCAVELQAMQVPQWQRLRAQPGGLLDAQGLWLLRADQGHTCITWVWRVHGARGWPQALAALAGPALRPLLQAPLEHRHRQLMRGLEAGLRQHLARRMTGPPRA